jgi:hypothetical protein
MGSSSPRAGPAIAAQKAEARRSKQRQPPLRSHASLRQAFPDLIPAKPYCADFLDDGLRIRSRQIALRRRHIQINGPSSFTWMPHDIDRDGAHYAHDDSNVPQPNVIMINPENGHAHSAYLLAAPVARHSASRIGPLRFYGAVERGIARRLGADRRYTGLITKNPLHTDWRVEWRRDQPYTLSELADWLFDGDMAPDPCVETTLGAGRNVAIFDELRAVAYREVLKFKRDDPGVTGLDAFRARLEAVALGINLQFPEAINLSEVRAIAKSVAKWTWSRFTPEKFSQLQGHRGKVRTRRNRAIAQEIKEGSADPTRRTISAASLATSLNKSVRTARRVWAEPRHLYEARSRARQRPWEADGVSRATWYRRRRLAENGQC